MSKKEVAEQLRAMARELIQQEPLKTKMQEIMSQAFEKILINSSSQDMATKFADALWNATRSNRY